MLASGVLEGPMRSRGKMAAQPSVATATGVANHNRPSLNPRQQRKRPRERSRDHQRKRRTERRRWGQEHRLRRGGAREARPETRANTGGTGKKNPNRERLGFHYWWRRGESNPRPQILRPWHYMLSLVLVLTFRNPTGRTTNGGSG